MLKHDRTTLTNSSTYFTKKRDIHSNSICRTRVQNVTSTFCIHILSLTYTVACSHEHSRFWRTIFKFPRFSVNGCFYTECYNNLPLPQVERVYGTMVGWNLAYITGEKFLDYLRTVNFSNTLLLFYDCDYHDYDDYYPGGGGSSCVVVVVVVIMINNNNNNKIRK